MRAVFGILRHEEGLAMRIVVARLWVLPILALVASACAMHHPHHRHMGMGCGPGSCGYQSKCFSEGAVRSNDGVCQTCSGGKWIGATGCSDPDCRACCAMMGDAPCPHAAKRGRRATK
jgi:hypothetical protein